MKLWIARDKDGKITLYDSKPYLDEDIGKWQGNQFGYRCWSMPSFIYPELTFKNSPQEIKLGLEKESIIKILKTYDNIFGLSDGGIARDEGDFEHIAEVIIKNM